MKVCTLNIRYVIELREHQLSIDCDIPGQSTHDAVKALVMWAKNRQENLEEIDIITSMSVSMKEIGQSDKDGFVDTRNCGRIFEWKYDWPGLLRHYLKDYDEELLKICDEVQQIERLAKLRGVEIK